MYEVLSELEEKGLLKKAIESGIIQITLAGQKFVYEMYLKYFRESIEESEAKRKHDAVKLTKIKTNTSIQHIYRIIKKMEG